MHDLDAPIASWAPTGAIEATAGAAGAGWQPVRAPAINAGGKAEPRN